MSFFKKKFLLALIFLVTTTCAGQTPKEKLTPKSKIARQLMALENSLKTRGGYNSYLALEYLTFARSLFSIGDEKNSDYFMKKGVGAANNDYLVPENPITWQADPTQIEEMVLMQKRLEDVLDQPHITFYLPIQTAHLTFLYDCWISRESKAVFRADELAGCRVRFSKLLDEIEHYIDAAKKDKQLPTTITEPKFERFEVLFDLGLYKLNDYANKNLIKIIKYLITLNGEYRILVVGNADRVGPEIANQNLAFQRAEVVRNYLVKNGVPQDAVELRSIGEDFPDILTKDGTQQQSNRSVGIYVLKGARSFSAFPLPLIINEIYRKEIEQARFERGLE